MAREIRVSISTICMLRENIRVVGAMVEMLQGNNEFCGPEDGAFFVLSVSCLRCCQDGCALPVCALWAVGVLPI